MAGVHNAGVQAAPVEFRAAMRDGPGPWFVDLEFARGAWARRADGGDWRGWPGRFVYIGTRPDCEAILDAAGDDASFMWIDKVSIFGWRVVNKWRAPCLQYMTRNYRFVSEFRSYLRINGYDGRIT